MGAVGWNRHERLNTKKPIWREENLERGVKAAAKQTSCTMIITSSGFVYRWHGWFHMKNMFTVQTVFIISSTVKPHMWRGLIVSAVRADKRGNFPKVKNEMLKRSPFEANPSTIVGFQTIRERFNPEWQLLIFNARPIN